MTVSLKDLIVELSVASSAEEIGRAHLAVANRFGVAVNLIVDMTKSFDGIGPAIVYAAQGREPFETLDAIERVTSNPLFSRAKVSEQPFTMLELKREEGISDEKWWSYFGPYFRGYDGFVVPVHENGALAWYVGCAGPAPDLSWRARSILQAAAFAARDRFRELMDPASSKSPLMAREAECLRLVSQGKSDEAIGMELNISPRTVRFHIGNAKTKLGVTTRIQAVAKRLGAA